MSARLLGAKRSGFKFSITRDLDSAHKIYKVLAARSLFFKVLDARKIYLITARARKNKRTARMLASARKDHSIPLVLKCLTSHSRAAKYGQTTHP